MPRGKRKATGPPAKLTATSSRQEVKAWVQAVLPADIAKQVISGWQESGELYDGETLLAADEQLLMETGAARTVAKRIVSKIKEQQLAVQAVEAEKGGQAEDAQVQSHNGGQEGQPQLSCAAADAALHDHAMQLSAGPRPRRASRRLPEKLQSKGEGEEEEKGDGGQGKGSDWQPSVHVMTRRQRVQAAAHSTAHPQQAEADEAQAEAAHKKNQQQGSAPRVRRGGRISSVTVVQAQPRGETSAVAAAPSVVIAQTACQPSDGAGDLPEVGNRQGPLVLEDLGPEMRSNQYAMEWEVRCRQGMDELLSDFMPVDKLIALCEEVAEEWPDWEAVGDCIREHKRVDGVKRWVVHKRPEPIVKKLLKVLVASRSTTHGVGMSREGVEELLRLPHCEDAVAAFVETRLRQRHRNLPDSSDLHRLLWSSWEVPNGKRLPPDSVLLGSREFCVVSVHPMAGLDPGSSGSVAWSDVWSALQHGLLSVAEQDQHMQWLQEVNSFSLATKCSVGARLVRAPGRRCLKVDLRTNWRKDRAGSNLVAVSHVKQPEVPASCVQYACDKELEPLYDECDGELAVADLALLLGQCDEHRGTPFADQLSSLKAAAAATEQQVSGRGLETVLPLAKPLSKAQFDRVVKPLVEAAERQEPAGFRARCDAALKLQLSEYQRRTVAHMLQEETAEGGSSRHLWVHMDLPKDPEVFCFVSPVLGQLRMSSSKSSIQLWTHSCGGAGLVALEVGMGKTACAVAVTQLNPPDAEWRKNRAHQTPRAHDYLSAHVNNMQHGGTLIVVPTAIVSQWSDEIRKTTSAPLSICRWVDGTKQAPLSHDCAQLASFDVVLVDTNTLKKAANLQTVCSIRWHRVIVDEAQQQGGMLNNSEGQLWANHRWLLTGTPENDNNLDTMAAQWSFLKLAPHKPMLTHLPAVLTHVLKNSMIFFRKAGRIDGRVNLELPPTADRVINCKMTDEDATWYQITEDEMRDKYRRLLGRLHLNPDTLEEFMNATHTWPQFRSTLKLDMAKLRALVGPLRQAASCAFKPATGNEMYDPVTGRYVKETYCFTSKVEAVLDVLRAKGPTEKVVVFTEFKPLLQAVKRRLPELGLQCRDLLGNAKACTRGQAISDFQMAPPTQVFFLTHRTGGSGVAHIGHHVVLCEPVLNPTFEEQAIGRCSRFGQRQAVTVTRLVMEGTIEEKIVEFMEGIQRTHAGGHSADDAGDLERSSKLTIEDVHWMVYGTYLAREERAEKEEWQRLQAEREEEQRQRVQEGEGEGDKEEEQRQGAGERQLEEDEESFEGCGYMGTYGCPCEGCINSRRGRRFPCEIAEERRQERWERGARCIGYGGYDSCDDYDSYGD